MLQRYADLLAGAGVERGLLGPRERERIWSRHLVNCAVLADLVPPGSAVCDVGSGAGLPGVVLAVQRPDCRVTLLEPLLRRVEFLSEVVEDLGLTGVRVVRGRAEEQPRRAFDVATARAVAPLGRLAEWAIPLLRPGGVLLALKGSRAGDEVRQSRAALARLGVLDAQVLTIPTVSEHAALAEDATGTCVVRLRAPDQAARPPLRSRMGRSSLPSRRPRV